MSQSESYKYRKALPEVLNIVHKKIVIGALTRLGIATSMDDSWETWANLKNAPYTLLMLDHSGTNNFGPLFGQSAYLETTEPTYITLRRGLYGDSMARKIYVGTSSHAPHDHLAEISLLPDTPPFALHADDVKYVSKRILSSDRETNEWAEINAVQRAFGDDAVEFLSEETAKRLIYAIQHDVATLPPDDSLEVPFP